MVESIRQTVPIHDPDSGELIGTAEQFTFRQELPNGQLWTYIQLYPPALVEDLGENKIWEFVERDSQQAQGGQK